MWKFETERFTIKVTAETKYDIDLSWDETGEFSEKFANGTYQVFCAKAAVYLDGLEIATDYLGNCIYENPADFRDHIGLGEIAAKEAAHKKMRRALADRARDMKNAQERYERGTITHRDYQRFYRGAQNRSAEIIRTYRHEMAIAGRCGSYFSDMVRKVISEARNHIKNHPAPYVRAA